MISALISGNQSSQPRISDWAVVLVSIRGHNFAGSARGTPPVWVNESSAQYPCVKRHRSCSNERRAEGLTTPVDDGDGERPPMARVRLSPPPRRRPGHRARRPASRSLVVPAGGVPRSQIGEGRSAPIRGDGTTRVGKKGMLLLYRPGIVPALEAPCS